MHNFNLFENVVSEMLKNFLFYFYFTSCIIGLKEQSINLTKNMLVISSGHYLFFYTVFMNSGLVHNISFMECIDEFLSITYFNLSHCIKFH